MKKVILNILIFSSSFSWCHKAMHDAIGRHDVEAIKKLIAQGADLYEIDILVGTPLHAAAKYNHVDIMKILIDAGANKEVWDYHHKRTALHIAAFHGNIQAVQYLIDVGANINARDSDGCTPLHLTTHDFNDNNNIEVVQLLISAGANLEIKGLFGDTPLHAAARWGKTQTVKDLIAAKANVEARNDSQETPLHEAARNQNYDGFEKVTLLLAAGAKVQVIDKNKRTPLHHAAASYKGAPIAKALIDAGADMEAKNAEGETPRDCADRIEVKEYLIAASINKYVKDDQRKTKVEYGQRKTTWQECPATAVLMALAEPGDLS